MKSAICYYSFTGNTKIAAEILKDILAEKGIVDLVELRPKKEDKNFFMQGFKSFLKKETELNNIKYDFTEYDFIAVGSPVWAFGPAPAVRTFLKHVTGVNDKQVILFVTSRGAGDHKAMKEMARYLKEKGVKDFKYVSINHNRIKDTKYLKTKIIKVIDERL